MVFGTFFDADVNQTDNMLGRKIEQADFQKISDAWVEYCDVEGIKIPPPALKELAKRVKACGAHGGKPKLELKNMKLDAKHVKNLLKVLAVNPLISKVALDGNNIPDKTLEVLVRLLQGQLNLVKVGNCFDISSKHD